RGNHDGGRIFSFCDAEYFQKLVWGKWSGLRLLLCGGARLFLSDCGAGRIASGAGGYSVSLQASAGVSAGDVGSELVSATTFSGYVRRGECSGQLAQLVERQFRRQRCSAGV